MLEFLTTNWISKLRLLNEVPPPCIVIITDFGMPISLASNMQFDMALTTYRGGDFGFDRGFPDSLVRPRPLMMVDGPVSDAPAARRTSSRLVGEPRTTVRPGISGNTAESLTRAMMLCPLFKASSINSDLCDHLRPQRKGLDSEFGCYAPSLQAYLVLTILLLQF